MKFLMGLNYVMYNDRLFHFFCNNFCLKSFLVRHMDKVRGVICCLQTYSCHNSFNGCSLLSFKITLYFYFSYRGGVDSEGRPVMVIVGAHFLLRCLDLDRFVLYVVKVIRVWLHFDITPCINTFPL